MLSWARRNTFKSAYGKATQIDRACRPERLGTSGAELQPLRLFEDAETGDHFVLFAKPDGAELQLRFDGEEPWATRKQMAEVFGVTVQTIDYHVKNILQSPMN